MLGRCADLSRPEVFVRCTAPVCVSMAILGYLRGCVYTAGAGSREGCFVVSFLGLCDVSARVSVLLIKTARAGRLRGSLPRGSPPRSAFVMDAKRLSETKGMVRRAAFGRSPRVRHLLPRAPIRIPLLPSSSAGRVRTAAHRSWTMRRIQDLEACCARSVRGTSI